MRLFNIGVRGWDVCFRLVVIVITDKVLNMVLGEKMLELSEKLSSKCFIMSDNQGWPIALLDYFSHREGFSGSCYANENLAFLFC